MRCCPRCGSWPLVVVAVLLPALVILWGLPSDTADLWAWTIKPALTPIFMGAGYGAGAYFFTRVYLTKGWHEVSVGVISAAAFALLMLITTVLHFEKFNQGKAHDGLPDPPALATIAYYGWTIVYILSPWIVGLAVVAKPAARPARARARRAARAANVRLVARVIAIGALLGAAVMLLSPDTAIEHWGWNLTPLTARVLGCFTAQVGTGFLLLSLRRRAGAAGACSCRRSSSRSRCCSSARRARGTPSTTTSMQWAYLAGLAGGAIALLALYRTCERAPATDPA